MTVRLRKGRSPVGAAATRDSRELRVVGAGRTFDGVVALDDVSLTLRSGELVGLIGPNGAGKSTLVNLISGVDTPSSGTVELDGVDLVSWAPAKRARAGIARSFQHGHVLPELTVRENVEVAALAVGMSAARSRRRAADLLAAFDLSAVEKAPARMLSHGHERRLGVARALAGSPDFLLLDEPAAGLSDQDVRVFAEVIGEARSSYEVGILLIDHNVPLVLGICNRVVVLDRGQVLAEGTPEEVRTNPLVASTYLGTEGVAT